MDFDNILHELETYRFWSSKDKPTLDLIPCKYCDTVPMVYIANPIYGRSGATVRCPHCGAQGPNASIYTTIVKGKSLHTPLLPESLKHGVNAAMAAWNEGKADKKQLGNMLLKK